jgi:hypothetical protein
MADILTPSSLLNIEKIEGTTKDEDISLPLHAIPYACALRLLSLRNKFMAMRDETEHDKIARLSKIPVKFCIE